MAILKADKTSTLGGVTINEYLLTNHNPNKIDMPTTALNEVIGITVHNTDWISVASGTTPAEQYTRATVNGNMKDVRVHYYVDNVCGWQNLPLTISGWHAADGSGDGNRKTIAIECIMSSAYNDTDKKSEDNCAKLAAALLKKYNLDINHLYTHTHWLNVRDGKKGTVDELNVMKNSYKMCPAYILPHWNEFKAKVQSYMGSSTTSNNSGTNTATTSSNVQKGSLVSIASNATYYTGSNIPSWVKSQKWYVSSISGDRAVLGKNEKGDQDIQSPVNTKYLSVVGASFKSYTVSLPANTNVYADAGVTNKVSTTIKSTGTYTIIEEKTINGVKWGKLKSGAGWVNLSNPAPKVDDTIRVGDKVKVTNAVQYNGKSFKVYCDSYYVLEVKGDRVVISSDNKNVTAAVNAKNLKKI
jgi:N-acetylmuramoyl-L-alanine amidase CwlA